MSTMAKRKPSTSSELYIKYKDTKKAGDLLTSLSDAVSEGHKGKQRQCGALGRLLAEGKVSAVDPLFPTKGYRRGQGADYSIRHALRADDEDSRVYVVTSFSSLKTHVRSVCYDRTGSPSSALLISTHAPDRFHTLSSASISRTPGKEYGRHDESNRYR
jgi:hypothetical protein